MRITFVIFSFLFAATNIIIIAKFPTTLSCSTYVDIKSGNQNLNSSASQITVDLHIFFWVLFTYHLFESLSNIFELIQLNDNTYQPVASWFISLNGCFGFCIFVYAQILFFGQLNQCEDHENFYGKLVFFWILIEIGGFYISCLSSIMILTGLYFYIKRSQTFHLQSEVSNNDDHFKKV